MSHTLFLEAGKPLWTSLRRNGFGHALRALAVIALIIGSLWGSSVGAEEVLYKDQKRKLKFMLDPVSKTASVGTGAISDDEAALLYPEIGSSEWNTDYWKVWNSVEIPETITYDGVAYTVTSVGTNAFSKCTYIKQLSLPSTIKNIGYRAFNYCVNLTDFDFPANLEVIGGSAFQLCKSMTKIILPSKVKSIGGSAFHDCMAAEELFIPASCMSIDNEAFNWCTGLKKIVLEDGPATLTMGYCFEKGISYQGTAGSKMRGMFGDSDNIREFHWGRNLKLTAHSSGLLYTPFLYTANYYTSTSGAQVQSSRSIGKLTFGEYVTEIPRNAFYNGSIGGSLVLPSNLKRIGDEAFNLAFCVAPVLTLPSSVEFIGNRAFEWANGFSTKILVAEGAIPPQTSWDESSKSGYPFYYAKASNLLINVPGGAGEAWRNDSFWGKFAIADDADEMITVNVKTPGSFYGRLSAQGAQIETTRRLKILGNMNDTDWETLSQMKNLYELDMEESEITELSDVLPHRIFRLKLPSKLNTIWGNALSGLPISGTLKIPETCTYIGKNGASGLLIDELILPDNGMQISAYSFASLYNLKEVRLGNVLVLGNNAFTNCGLEKVTLGEGCEIGGQRTFDDCDRLETVIIDGTVKNLGTETFSQSVSDTKRHSIRRFVFNGRVIKSGTEVFKDSLYSQYEQYVDPVDPTWTLEINDLEGYLSSSFTGVTSSPMNFAKEVICNGAQLTEVVVPEGTTEVFDAMFRNCKTLAKITLPASIKRIGTAAFEGSAIESIALPDALEIISFNAFKGCENLEEAVIPKTIKAIGFGAYNNCTSLKSVYAFLSDPFALETSSKYKNDLPFNDVDQECCLYIPIGTLTKYRTAKWIFPKVQERGTLSITVKGSGYVTYDGTTVSTGTKEFYFRPYVPFDIVIAAANGQTIKSVTLNGQDVTAKVTEGKLSFDDPDADMAVTVEFSKSILLGDSNDDGVIDIADAVNIANYIIGLSTTNFNFQTSDINSDKAITVSDVTSAVTLIGKQNYQSAPRKIKKSRTIAAPSGVLSWSKLNSSLYAAHVSSDDDLTALQFDITVENNALAPVGYLSDDVAKTHILQQIRVNATTVRVIVFSATSAILPVDHTLLTIVASDVPACDNVIASTVEGMSKRLASESAMSGIEQIGAEGVCVLGMTGRIRIVNAYGKRIAVYTPSGLLVDSQLANEDVVHIDAARGCYIVTVDAVAFKVLVK